MENYGIFDILGPIMIGPSSSHTAGAARIGEVARYIADFELGKVIFHLHGSFAKTYKGHGTDKALVAGILGMEPHDERLRSSFEIAKDRGIDIEFKKADLGIVHPNTVKIELFGKNEEKATVTGTSIGGGAIVITDVNGFQIYFTDEYPTIMITQTDKKGVISRVSALLTSNGINIAKMTVNRKIRGEVATMIIETDSLISDEIKTALENIEDVLTLRVINPVREEL